MALYKNLHICKILVDLAPTWELIKQILVLTSITCIACIKQ